MIVHEIEAILALCDMRKLIMQLGGASSIMVG